MNNLFNYENGIMSKIAQIADIVTLGVFWVIFSLPLITLGASSAAFYYSYTKCIRQKTGYAWKTFFQSFKSNFKQATGIWLGVLAALLMAALDSYLMGLTDKFTVALNLLRAVIFILTLFCIIWSLYIFPYISRFALSTKAAAKNCILIMLANFPSSLLLLLLFVVCGVSFVCLPLLNLFIPSIYMLFANRILEKVFQKYMPPEDVSQIQ